MARRYSVILLLGFLVLTGCAAQSDTGDVSSESPSPSPSMSHEQGAPSSEPDSPEPPTPASPPLSSTPPLASRPPSGPPKKPTDQVAAYWTSGTVTRGGEGPCYGLATDGGVELALYTSAGIELVEGEQVRVRVRAASFRVDCGPGQLMSLQEIDRG